MAQNDNIMKNLRTKIFPGGPTETFYVALAANDILGLSGGGEGDSLGMGPRWHSLYPSPFRHKIYILPTCQNRCLPKRLWPLTSHHWATGSGTNSTSGYLSKYFSMVDFPLPGKRTQVERGIYITSTMLKAVFPDLDPHSVCLLDPDPVFRM
jgi:hypothetical protein